MAGGAIDLVIRQVQTSEANRALIHDEIGRLSKSLGEPEASPTERLLIDQVVICYLRMNFTEQYYDTTMTDGCSLAAASYWERKLASRGRHAESRVSRVDRCLNHCQNAGLDWL